MSTCASNHNLRLPWVRTGRTDCIKCGLNTKYKYTITHASSSEEGLIIPYSMINLTSTISYRVLTRMPPTIMCSSTEYSWEQPSRTMSLLGCMDGNKSPMLVKATYEFIPTWEHQLKTLAITWLDYSNKASIPDTSDKHSTQSLVYTCPLHYTLLSLTFHQYQYLKIMMILQIANLSLPPTTQSTLWHHCHPTS